MMEENMFFQDCWPLEERIATIKLRLYNFLKLEQDKKNTVIKEEVRESTGIDCNLTTLQNTINPYDNSARSINTMCIIGICQTYDLNIAAVLSAPRIDLMDGEKIDLKKYNPNNDVNIHLYPNEKNDQNTSYGKGIYESLNNKHYFNINSNGSIIPYYGYMYSANPEIPFPITFELKLSPKGAHLKIKNPSDNSDGTFTYNYAEYTGSPVVAKAKNEIHIFFKNDLGSYYIFSFSYIEYKTQNMYYRKGCILTQGRDSSQSPMMQSFVIFNKPVPEENMCYIPGLLRLCNETFYISESDLNRVKENTSVELLWGEYGKYFELSAQTMYKINEAIIMKDDNLNAGVIKKDEIIKGIQLLKSVSASPTRLYYPEDKVYASFSKTLIQDDQQGREQIPE